LIDDISKIRNDQTIRDETTRKALIDARLGMGKFRSDLQRRWKGQCAVTGCRLPELLRASHIKPWSESNNRERLDPGNGLLLSAHLDALFDNGLISFDDNGKMLLSRRLGTKDKTLFQLPANLRFKPTTSESRFLRLHRQMLATE
jgi:predicted restriction endonuclease